MASTTTVKKGIIDFLWEWADNHGDWGKWLVDTVVRTETPLSPQDRQLVFDYFIDSLRAVKQLPQINLVKPQYVPTSKKIALICLKDVTGVNRLAKNQNLLFDKNITIVYGENGTGKTGYGRILKSLGFSYDTNNIVHHNIYGNPEAKNATIEFKINGTSTIPFIWDGSNSHAELSNISVFNNNCVQVSLGDRQLIVAPIGFHLFNIITSELTELAVLLRQKIASHPTTLSWADMLTLGTPQQIFISSLTASSQELRLIELSTFTLEHETELQQKEGELANLNQELLRVQISNLAAQMSELNNIISKIKTDKTLFNSAKWKELKNLNKSIVELESKAQLGLKEIADANGIEFYETKEFKDFISAADVYLKTLDKPNYPSSADHCLYCNQPLEDSAMNLLAQYKKLLNDTTQGDLQLKINERQTLINSINPIQINHSISQPIFGIDAMQNCIQPTEIVDYNRELSVLKNTFISNSLDEASAFNFVYDTFVTFLESTKDGIAETVNSKTKTLSEISTRETSLRLAINELKDRKITSIRVEEVKTALKNLKIVSILNSRANDFNTSSISRKTTEAREHLVRQNFDLIFQNELQAFRKSHLPVRLDFGTDRGNSKVTQRINSYSLTEILSEGEQKAIALAEFLTELQLDNNKAPVIFDDPVNSLDHRIIDEVAKRIIDLSQGRQVIIFTHSILLLNSLIQQSELDTNRQAGISFTFYSVKNNFQETGIIDDVEEVNSFTYYKRKLELVIATQPNGQSEAKLAAEGYGHLRSAIEICVEEDILKKTVKRYRKGVAFPSLLRIEGDKIDTHKGRLNDIYEKCCVSIAGHSSPSEVDTTSTMDELKADYEVFKQLRRNFTS